MAYYILFLSECIGIIYLQITEIEFFVPVRNLTQDSAGISHSHGICRNVPGYDAACTDDGIVTNGHTGQNNTMGTDPDIVTNADGQRVMGNHFPI